MPTILLLGIPLVVAILFLGIMNLPDEEIKSELISPKKAEKKKKKSK